MKKYYFVKTFFIEKKDITDLQSEEIFVLPNEYVGISSSNATTLIATKERGHYREIETGRIIPDVKLSLHYNAANYRLLGRTGYAILGKRALKKLKNTGAILVTSSRFSGHPNVYPEKEITIGHEYGLIHRVESLDKVKEYLEMGTGKKAFEKLDEARRIGTVAAKKERKEEKMQRMEDAREVLKEKLNDAKESAERKVEEHKKEREQKMQENQLSTSIKNEIKRRR